MLQVVLYILAAFGLALVLAEVFAGRARGACSDCPARLRISPKEGDDIFRAVACALLAKERLPFLEVEIEGMDEKTAGETIFSVEDAMKQEGKWTRRYWMS